jgi:hypothetical protein
MSGTKQNGSTSQTAAEFDNDTAVAEAPKTMRPKPNGTKGREVTNWDAYRNWLTKVQAPEQKRALPDPALFSFKSYRSWAEKVRRDWDHDE